MQVIKIINRFDIVQNNVDFPSQIPLDEVLVRVRWSSINFKDILSCKGNPAIIRKFPHTPGLDAAGEVVVSKNKKFPVGTQVIVYCRGLGTNRSGGFSEYIQVPVSWCEPKPSGISLQEAMIIGTAGFTAALAVDTLNRLGLTKPCKHLAITGATGGVGSMAIAMLQKQSCNITAIVSRGSNLDFLNQIGVSQIQYRQDILNGVTQNLLQPDFDAIIDVAGGELLANLLKKLKPNGVGIATGLAESTALKTNMLPFILRGIRLIGINAENTKENNRKRLWEKIESSYAPDSLKPFYSEVTLEDLPYLLKNICLEGRKVYGRVLVDCGPW